MLVSNREFNLIDCVWVGAMDASSFCTIALSSDVQYERTMSENL